MPLGNGGPRGLPSMPLGVLNDPRSYGTKPSSGGGAFQTIDHPGVAPHAISHMSPYARAVASTPGLAYWWRMGEIRTDAAEGWNSSWIPNCAGSTTLNTFGTVNIVPGLIPGDRDGAAQLVASGSGNLKEGDYWIPNVQGQECFSQEVWVKLTSPTSGNYSLGGAWDGTHGWMLYVHGTDGHVYLYIGSTAWDTGYALQANTVYHIVAVYGGPADFRSHLYINGKEAASTAAYGTLGLFSAAFNFEVGKYNSTAAGAAYLDGIVDELALYTRMLQPAEVLQHYQAAFARA